MRKRLAGWLCTVYDDSRSATVHVLVTVARWLEASPKGSIGSYSHRTHRYDQLLHFYPIHFPSAMVRIESLCQQIEYPNRGWHACLCWLRFRRCLGQHRCVSTGSRNITNIGGLGFVVHLFFSTWQIFSSLLGFPPDDCSAEGQNWNTPLYQWNDESKKPAVFRWWIQRLRKTLEIVDVVRIDHFRGLESYWSIPVDEHFVPLQPKDGEWKKTP